MRKSHRLPSRERRTGARFEVRMPMRYRALDASTWHDAHTENVGKSGVFFRCAEELQADTPIDMVLSLPVGFGGDSGATTVCRGRIVRVEAEARPGARIGIAATIDSYLMMHGDPRRI